MTTPVPSAALIGTLIALDVGNPPETFNYPLLLILLLLAFIAIPTVIILLRRARRRGKGG